MSGAALIIIGFVAYTIYKRKPVANVYLPPFTVTPPGSSGYGGNGGSTTPPNTGGETWDGDNTVPPPVYIPPAQSGTNAETKNLLGQSGYPRGMRNNNPGNIRIGVSPWTGKVPIAQNTDGAFEQFVLYKWGVRAMIKLIRNYIAGGNNTIVKIINKYAPSSENNTTAYINNVAQKSGVNPNAVLNANDFNLLQLIIIAMAHHENGRADAITADDFYTAWQLL